MYCPPNKKNCPTDKNYCPPENFFCPPRIDSCPADNTFSPPKFSLILVCPPNGIVRQTDLSDGQLYAKVLRPNYIVNFISYKIYI